MSRLNSNVAVALLLLSSASLAWAQEGVMNSITSASVKEDKLLDLSLPSVNDPAAVEMLFREGSTIQSILDGLKDKGFHIEYREKHLTPEMTLLALPEKTRIDEVLREILEPWNLRVYRSPLGKWIVTPNRKKATPAPRDETHDKLRDIAREGAG